MHLLLTGLLLGWGAAIPIGPINLEIIRRNLRFGTLQAMCLGFGACSADLTYLLLLSLGMLTFLSHPEILRVLGIIGALILAWFGISAWRLQAKELKQKENSASYFKHYFEGYLLTLLNPYTVLFWLSVSAQIASLTINNHAILLMSTGVLMGTISWILGLSLVLHFTRHRFSTNIISYLNKIGAIILLGFAVMGLYHNIIN